jgi:hypothetical protein
VDKDLAPGQTGEGGGDLANRGHRVSELEGDLLAVVADPAFEINGLPLHVLGLTRGLLVLHRLKIVNQAPALGVLVGPPTVQTAQASQSIRHLFGVVGKRLRDTDRSFRRNDHDLDVGLHDFAEETANLGQHPVAVEGANVFVIDVEHQVNRLDTCGQRGNTFFLFGRGFIDAVVGNRERDDRRRLAFPALHDLGNHLLRICGKVAESSYLAVLFEDEIILSETGDDIVFSIADKDIDVDHRDLDLIDKGQATNDLFGVRLLTGNHQGDRQNDGRGRHDQAQGRGRPHNRSHHTSEYFSHLGFRSSPGGSTDLRSRG